MWFTASCACLEGISITTAAPIIMDISRAGARWLTGAIRSAKSGHMIRRSLIQTVIVITEVKNFS